MGSALQIAACQAAFAFDLLFFSVGGRAREPVRGRVDGLRRGVSRMGPRHASGGLGRTPNPGLAVCAGQRTRASGDRAYMDVLAAPPAQPIYPAPPMNCFARPPTRGCAVG